MAGLRGNTGWIMAQKQTVAGTPAVPAVPGAGIGAFKSPQTGNGALEPVRNVNQLSETDASRDQGVSYVATSDVTGSPEIYGRDDSLGFWLQAVLGADAVTGTSPNFTHVFTPASTIPYITCWRDVSDTLWEQFLDCKVGTLVIAAQANSPLTVTPTIHGRTSTRLATDPSLSPAITLGSGYVYNYNDATVTLSGGVTANVTQFSLTIDNGVQTQHSDNVQPLDVIEGLRKVSLSFDLLFTDLNEYNKFNYGSTSGTTVTNSIYTTSADFSFAHGANNNLDFSLPSIAFDAFPVNVNAAGNPITVAVTAVSQRGGSPVITATVKNQVALY